MSFIYENVEADEEAQICRIDSFRLTQAQWRKCQDLARYHVKKMPRYLDLFAYRILDRTRDIMTTAHHRTHL